MMEGTKRSLISLSIFMSLFLLGGVIHIAAWGVDGLNNITELYYCLMLLVWIISIQKRIIDPKIRLLLIKSAGLMIIIYLLQTCRFLLMTGLLTVNRYLIYADYVSGLFQASYFLEIGLCLGGFRKKTYFYKIIYIPAIVFSLLILTNDLHQLVIYYPDGLINAKTSYSYRAGMFIYYGWLITAYIGYIYHTFKSCRVFSDKKSVWLPIFFPIAGGILLGLHFFGLPKFNGHIIWQIEDEMLLIILGVAESCIELGIIPSNTDYNRLFKLTKNKAVITDSGGNVIYSSSEDEEIPLPDECVTIDSKKIHGGKITWAVDISSINRLNRQLEEATEEIDLRNAYLRHQNELDREKSQLDARNRLYDRISSIVRPQLERVNRLLDRLQQTENPDNNDGGCDEKTGQLLAKIAVLNAYIKRRSNMELLSDVSDRITLKELFLALSESGEYIKLCGVTVMVPPVADEELSATTIITAYEFFEAVVEAVIENMTTLMVNISFMDNEPVLRILTDTVTEEDPGVSFTERFSELKARYSVEKEEMETTFVLRFCKGGDAVC